MSWFYSLPLDHNFGKPLSFSYVYCDFIAFNVGIREAMEFTGSVEPRTISVLLVDSKIKSIDSYKVF
jgi:hypothetical protein